MTAGTPEGRDSEATFADAERAHAPSGIVRAADPITGPTGPTCCSHDHSRDAEQWSHAPSGGTVEALQPWRRVSSPDAGATSRPQPWDQHLADQVNALSEENERLVYRIGDLERALRGQCHRIETAIAGMLAEDPTRDVSPARANLQVLQDVLREAAERDRAPVPSYVRPGAA